MANRYVLLFLVSVMLGKTAFAQQQEAFVRDTAIMVETGTRLNDVIPLKHQLHYPGFRTGKVYFRDERMHEARLNYNRLLDEMLFINAKGDTLALDNEPTISRIVIGSDSFYYDQGYVLAVKTIGTLNLGVKHLLRVKEKRKESGYGFMSGTAGVTSYSTIDDGRTVYKLKIREQIVVTKLDEFYLMDKYNHFTLITLDNVLELFPKHSGSLKKFCKRKKIDFNKLEDVERVVVFLAGLK